jgi:hypothetical protein
MEIFRGEDDVELAVDIDDIALAELAGDDLHDNSPWMESGLERDLRPRIRAAPYRS